MLGRRPWTGALSLPLGFLQQFAGAEDRQALSPATGDPCVGGTAGPLCAGQAGSCRCLPRAEAGLSSPGGLAVVPRVMAGLGGLRQAGTMGFPNCSARAGLGVRTPPASNLFQTIFLPFPASPWGSPRRGRRGVTSRDDGQASLPAWMLGWGSRGPPVHVLAPTFFEPGRWFRGGGWETRACRPIPALPLCDLRHRLSLSGPFLPHCVELD